MTSNGSCNRPGATIEVFQAKSASQTDLLAAVTAGAQYPQRQRRPDELGTSRIGVARRIGRPADETTGTPMTFVASTGDKSSPSGLAGGLFPAVSGQVLAVGGTNLLNNGWEGAGETGEVATAPPSRNRRSIQRSTDRKAVDSRRGLRGRSRKRISSGYRRNSRQMVHLRGTSVTRRNGPAC